MCITEQTIFRYCAHFEVTTTPCHCAVCPNELFIDLPGFSNQIRYTVSSIHNVCAGCRRAGLDRDIPPPQPQVTQPVERSPKYILRRAQTKNLPDNGLRVGLRFTIVESVHATFQDRVELKLRVVLPFIEVKSLEEDNKSCCICIHDYIDDDGTANEQVVKARCGHTFGLTCFRRMMENLDHTNTMVKEPYLCVRCPLCRQGVFEGD